MEIFRNVKAFGLHLKKISMRIKSLTAENLDTTFPVSSVLIAPNLVRRFFWFKSNSSKSRQGNIEGYVTTSLISQGTQKLSRSPVPGPAVWTYMVCKEILLCQILLEASGNCSNDWYSKYSCLVGSYPFIQWDWTFLVLFLLHVCQDYIHIYPSECRL